MDIDSFLNKLNADLDKQRENISSAYSQHSVNFCPYCGEELADGGRFCPHCGQELPNGNHNNEVEEASQKHLGRLTIYDELEESSKKCIETFNEIYTNVFLQETNKPLAKLSTDSSQFDYGSQAVALTRVAEVECTKSLYAYFHNGNDVKPNDVTFGVLIGEFRHPQQRVPKGMKDWNGFIESLTSLKDDRNAGAHGQKLFTGDKFIEFYEKYLVFYKYMPELLAVKEMVRKKYSKSSKLSAFATESKAAAESKADDYEYPDITPKREKYGVILTDCLQLAIKYYGNNAKIKIVDENGNLVRQESRSEYIRNEILYSYIEQCEQIGIHYELIDLSDEHWGLNVGEKHSWQTILNVLDTYYVMPHKWGNGTPALFIIGGDDVIQMPCVASDDFLYREPEKDKYIMERNVETDLLYAFDSSVVELTDDGTVKWQKLFNGIAPRFYVGRLPMENGLMTKSVEEDLVGYFQRVLTEYAGTGIKVKNPCYVSCATAITTTQAMVADFPKPNLEDEENLIQQGVFVCPGIVINRKDLFENNLNYAEELYLKALNQSDLCFFNMHSNQDPKGGFTGEVYLYKTDDKGNFIKDGNGHLIMAEHEYPPAYYPEIQHINNSRVFVSLCCWGAKFINYTREQSTLLSGIYNKNLLYIGSSRSAYGAFIPGVSPYKAQYDPQKDRAETFYRSGQCVLKSFMEYVLEGMDAGKALMQAKIDFVEKFQFHKSYAPIMILTVLEFNLFGDPLLHVKPVMQSKNASKASMFNADLDLGRFSTIYTKVGDCETSSEKMSVLTRVRNLVNTNIAEIRQRISKSLYQEYGLEPRNLQVMQKYEDSTGERTYISHYQDPDNFSDGAIAYTDESGNVKELLYKM